MKTFTLITCFFVSHFALANPHKMQDGNYADAWCLANEGTREVRIANLRADCVTKDKAVEVEFAEKWREGIFQAASYGEAFKRVPTLVLVIEATQDRLQVSLAKEYIRKNGLPIVVETFENKMSRVESIGLIDGPVVKKSRNGICHVKNVGSYAMTKSFTGFDSLSNCIASGGRKPKRINDSTLRQGELAAQNASAAKAAGSLQ